MRDHGLLSGSVSCMQHCETMVAVVLARQDKLREQCIWHAREKENASLRLACSAHWCAECDEDEQWHLGAMFAPLE
jgi:hypothetical protein